MGEGEKGINRQKCGIACEGDKSAKGAREMEKLREGEGQREKNIKGGTGVRSKEMEERVRILERRWKLAERDKRKRNIIVKEVKEVKEQEKDKTGNKGIGNANVD